MFEKSDRNKHLSHLSVLHAFAVLGALFLERYELALITAVMLALLLFTIFAKRWFDVHVPGLILLLSTSFVILSIGLGEMLNFYESYWWYDAVLHFFSAFLVGLIAFTIFYLLHVSGALRVSALLIAFLTFESAVTAGALWEIYEFTIDNLFGAAMQVNSLNDTMWDLILDTVGAVFVAVVVYVYMLRWYVPGAHETVDGAVDEAVRKNKDKV